MANQANGLSCTERVCKRHIVSTPKHRRKVTCSQYRDSLGEIFRWLRSCKGVEMMEGHLTPGHARMPAGVPPRISVPGFMGRLKGEGALMMSGRHANLKRKFGSRRLWPEGRRAPTAGSDGATVAKRIRGQEAPDIALGRLSVKECEDPLKKAQGRPSGAAGSTKAASCGLRTSQGRCALNEARATP